MERTLVLDVVGRNDQVVLIKGWVVTRRDHGKIVFLDLSDRSGLVQVVTTSDIASDIGVGYAVTVEGLVKKRPEKLINPKLATGTIEIEAKQIKTLAKAEPYPFDMGKPELDLELPTLLDYRGLTIRHPKVKAIFKLQEVVIDSFRKALGEKGFFEFQAPGLIPSVPEGGAEVFEVKYFDHKVYLAQSPQLYKSMLVSAFERVFSVNKVFRAEPSITTTHIAEFVSLDAELGFIDSWQDVRDMADYVIRYILSEVEKRCADELKIFGATIPEIKEKIPTLKMREAQQLIYERTGRDCRKEKDLAPEDEREICKWSKEVHGSELVFISHYMTKFRPFYTYPDNEEPEFNQGFDLLGRGREWLTGGRRINDYEVLMNHVKEWKIDPKNIEIYLQAFRFGMPPLGGFAFGAERITMYILGLANIREASLFPRDMERVDVRLSANEEQKNKP